MKDSLALALGLMLVLEGILPFLFPGQWRNTLSRVSRLSDGQVRFLGMMALLCGLGVLALIHLYS